MNGGQREHHIENKEEKTKKKTPSCFVPQRDIVERDSVPNGKKGGSFSFIPSIISLSLTVLHIHAMPVVGDFGKSPWDAAFQRPNA